MAGKACVRGPLGVVEIDADGDVVRMVSLTRRPPRDDGTGPLAADLRRYFAGEPVDFSRYEVDYTGYSPFERKVLRHLRTIPHGELRTYGEVAKAIGKPKAARAVGQAVGKNRIAIVVPCHRVVAANGIGGFGNDVEYKRVLLRLEGSWP